MMATPLTNLTDRDLMLNLWFSLLAITSDEGCQIDPSLCEQFVIRDRMMPNDSIESTNLADLMQEAQARCNIPWLLASIKAGHMN